MCAEGVPKESVIHAIILHREKEILSWFVVK